ncbi:hypothetical protein PQX77_010903 [Marasmius sp. AFHP31]|nr:hypothetical protein PQX77_010903 [Marasmius sp. AFHP31]
MADITPLPARGKHNVPKFNPDFEEQLLTSFDKLQDAASKTGIVNDHTAMKKECLRYVNVETIWLWRSLHTYKDNQKTWEEFKTEVLSDYLDAVQTAEVMMDELKKVVLEHSKMGVLSAVQAACHYVEVFPEQVRTRLDTRLQVQYPNKKKGKAFTLSELKGAIDYLLSDASTATLPGSFTPVIKSGPTRLPSVERQLQFLS